MPTNDPERIMVLVVIVVVDGSEAGGREEKMGSEREIAYQVDTSTPHASLSDGRNKRNLLVIGEWMGRRRSTAGSSAQSMTPPLFPGKDGQTADGGKKSKRRATARRAQTANWVYYPSSAAVERNRVKIITELKKQRIDANAVQTFKQFLNKGTDEQPRTLTHLDSITRSVHFGLQYIRHQVFTDIPELARTGSMNHCETGYR